MSHGCLCLHRSGSTKFNHKGKICGNNEAPNDACDKDDNDDPFCWNINELCTATGNLEEQYTYKFENPDDNGPNIGSSRSITPPKNYICITGTCTKTGRPNDEGGQLCTVIQPRVAGGVVTIESVNGQDISNYKIQYACGRACESDPGGDTPGGGGDGDPHIHTMKGDHYTLIKQGNFLAFSFKGKEALVAPAPYGSGSPGSHSHGDGASRVPVDFELFAHYNDGRKSFTRGLLLLDHQNHQAMELTSEDCRWQVRAGPVVTESSLVILVS